MRKTRVSSLTKVSSLLLLIILTFISVFPIQYAQAKVPQQFTGKVVGVSDGDTIKVMHLSKAEKVRLAGIDCPERKQAFGTRAKQFTSDLVFGKVVTVKVETTDQYGRTVGEVILSDGRSLNRELVKAGFAWWYRQYSRDTTLGQLEEHARAAKRGLWMDPHPVAPWEFRKIQKATR